MDVKSIRVDAREFLTVVGVAAAGLVLAALAAFTPWYAHGESDTAVIEMYGPIAPASAARR